MRAARSATPRASSRSPAASQSRFCRRLVEDNPAEARAPRRRADAGLRPRERLLRGPEERHRRPGQGQRGDRADRARGRAGRWSAPATSTTCAARTTTTTRRCCACRPSRTLAEPKMTLRHQRVLPEGLATRWRTRSREWPEAMATTLEIAERCNVEIELGKMLIPSYPTPDGEAEGEYLRRLAHEGLRRRYGDPPPAEAVERLEMELDVIEKMGFAAYFLIVWDFVKFAKDNGIAVGPGPRLGGGLDRLLRAADHRRRPARVRPAVRALPQRRAHLDAGHRHRLLGQGPRPRDPVRGRQVRRASRSRRSSPSAACSRARPRATPRACSASTTAPATGSRS